MTLIWTRRVLTILLVVLACSGSALPAEAQQDLEGVFQGLGTGTAVGEDEAPAAPRPGQGAVTGKVIDAESGAPVDRATVVLVWPGPADGSAPRQEVEVTGFDGSFSFSSVPPGRYALQFIKSGYRVSGMTDFQVIAGRASDASFPLPPLAIGSPGDTLELDAFVVTASTVGDMVSALELRLDSDQLLNVMSAEDFSRYAASDVAEALRRVAGVNVVEGQFAVIRGLEDRYSSTLYNGAPVPSPDPDRQSIQLDLFPSDVVSNLQIEKTFAPGSPSNSSAGSIDILTRDYPDGFELKLSAGSGFNDGATDRFLGRVDGSPIGRERAAEDVVEHDLSASLAGSREFWKRELRFRLVAANEVDYDTATGFQEAREPRPAEVRLFPRPEQVVRSGDLALGELNLTGGRFDLTQSTREEQTTAFGSLGADLDEAGRHRVDLSLFYTEKHDEIVQLRENGHLPGFDYQRLADAQAAGQEIDQDSDFNGFATFSSFIARTVRGDPNDSITRGPLWYASFLASQSFDRKRELLVTQLNGSHEFEPLDGLSLTWAANYARAKQKEQALGLRYFVEPDDPSQIPTSFPVTPADLAPGRFAANSGIFDTGQKVDEKQRFARIDLDYEFELGSHLDWQLSGGAWYEHNDRDVSSSFLQSPSVNGSSQFAVIRDTQRELGAAVFDELDRGTDGLLSGTRLAENDASREIEAGYLRGKATLWDDVDLFGGVRFEQIRIESNNDPFTGELAFDGSPAIFPTKWLFFDRLDNPARGETLRPPAPGTTFNDELVGIDVQVDPQTGFVDLADREEIEAFLNGEIDDLTLLPSAGFSYRPLDGLTLRGAYSQTTARPSFREMGFYVTVEPATDDQVVGNPQLDLSEVESFDLRMEYLWGDEGDLFAVSGFAKRIDDPIESLALRDPTNLDGASSAIFRTFFNNPNQARLYGLELEARSGFGFIALPVIEDFSVGANFTWIDARVKRSKIELARAEPFFGAAPGDEERFEGLSKSRRLFGQPEWIVNADLSFDKPEWGFETTLSVFAISDVLDAVGSATLQPTGSVLALTTDRYVDEFYQLDLVASETVPVPWIGGDLSFKVSVKNLTDSKRRIVFDPDQTARKIPEREFRIGRDYSFSLGYTRPF